MASPRDDAGRAEKKHLGHSLRNCQGEMVRAVRNRKGWYGREKEGRRSGVPAVKKRQWFRNKELVAYVKSC